MYPFIVLPPLPEKRVMFSWQKVATDTFDPDFVDRRRAGLEVVRLRNYNFYLLIIDFNHVGKGSLPSFLTLFHRTS